VVSLLPAAGAYVSEQRARRADRAKPPP